MKRIITFLLTLLAMNVACQDLKAQEITIVLNPGWNWISYPRADILDFSTAMGDFVPLVGDMIKSQSGFATYDHGQCYG